MATKADQSKTGKSNVRRGKTLERRVAKLLTEWTGETFRRRRVEGRDSTTIERDSTADVISVQKQTVFSIEVKNAKGFSLDALLANPETTKFVSWWHQATYDAHLLTDIYTTKIYPFLFFKPIPSWDWVAFPTESIGIIKSTDQNQSSDPWFPTIKFDWFDRMEPVSMNVSQSKKNPVMYELQLPSCYICRWVDFKNNVDPRSFFLC